MRPSFRVIDGGFEEMMERQRAEVAEASARFDKLPPPAEPPMLTPEQFKYVWALVEQQFDRNKRRRNRHIAGRCLIIEPLAFRPKPSPLKTGADRTIRFSSMSG